MNQKEWNMEIIRFGNWGVSPFGIEWKGRDDVQYNMTFNSMIQTGVHNQSILYQWLIDIAADSRLTNEDIYSLNTAFFYALDMFSTELDIPAYVLVAETLKAQQEMLDARKLKHQKIYVNR